MITFNNIQIINNKQHRLGNHGKKPLYFSLVQQILCLHKKNKLYGEK